MFLRVLGLGVLAAVSCVGVVYGETKAGAAEVPKAGLVYPKGLSALRMRLLLEAQLTAKKYHHFGYKFGGADPSAGGFDCSGAMYYVMGKVGLKRPRTSAQQYVWIRDAGRIHTVPEGVTSLEDKAFAALRPGDLLFWSGTYVPTDGRKVKITHVGMYLGKEKDGRHVMASSTNGRSYRGKKGNGYGIYDFRLPSAKSKSKFVGYGSPVGVE